MTKVAVVKAESYDQQVVEQAMSELLDHFGGMSQFVQPGDRVLVKPNMLEGVDKCHCVTTHPEVVRAVIRQVKNAGAIPLVGDSPGVGGTLKVAEKCGILKICQEEQATLLPFKEAVEIAFPQGRTVKKFTVAKAFTEADKVISLAKMKTHSFMGITGAIKNQFGFIVGAGKAQFHLRMNKRDDFACMLLDLVQLVRPVLFMVDGIVGMDGNGPRNGTPFPAGVLLAGTNGFAVDAVMAEMMGFAAEKLPVACQAAKLDLCPKFKDIELVGSGKDLRFKFKEPHSYESLESRLPKRLVDFCRQQLTSKPHIAGNCVGCGRCAAHCPPAAITMIKNKAVINYDKCIRCYCCQELCPENAVYLKDGLLLKLVKRKK